MRRTLTTLFLVLVVLTASADEADWRSAAPGFAWSFPRDHHAHPEYKTEWWYVTGHLQAEAGDELSFQQTMFRIGLDKTTAADSASAWAAHDLVMGHAALTDPGRNRHRFSEALWRAVPLLGGFGAPGDSVLAWCQAPPGTDDRWSIVLDGKDFLLRSRDDVVGLRYELRCTPRKPLVFHGDRGFSAKTADGEAGSLYYSATRMDVLGHVWREGRVLAVAGEAWLDREIFTDTLGPGQKGWDWFSLQFDDDRELMAYRLRDEDGGPGFALASLVSGDSDVLGLPGDAWTAEPLATWTSPETGAVYPVAWRLRCPQAGLDVELRAVMEAQENVSNRSGVHYWEGAVVVTVDGVAVGRGFVELTGYGEGSRPPV